METVVNPSLATAEPEMAFEAIDANEEVTTKLDLAKAYEEMGTSRAPVSCYRKCSRKVTPDSRMPPAPFWRESAADAFAR
jgi:hypothetical protein